MKLLVIGGVAAGMSAASKVKRTDSSAEVVVYEKGLFLSYGACGIPYYVAGLSGDYKKMIARTQEDFAKKGISTYLKHEAVRVAPERKQVMIRDIENGRMFLESYDKLMIATGASPIVPPIKGADLNGVYTIKTLDGAIALKEALDRPEVRNVVIIGGGYIGIEAAEALNESGKSVRVIELSDRILQTYDPEITEMATAELVEIGVALNLNERVVQITGSGKADGVITDKGTYSADLIIIAAGVKPNTGFLKGSGVELAKNGAIVIDREMRTNKEDVYAAGDCAEVYNAALQENAFLPLGTTANKCGRIAGNNILGKHEKYVGTLGSAAIKVGSLELGKTGLSEADAKRLAIDYTAAFVKALDHAHYYPDPTPVWVKMICEKRTRKILGAQAIGKKNVVLRVNAIAVAIQSGMSAPELGMTDMCYAPPFAGVWDAIHVACNVVK